MKTITILLFTLSLGAGAMAADNAKAVTPTATATVQPTPVPSPTPKTDGATTTVKKRVRATSDLRLDSMGQCYKLMVAGAGSFDLCEFTVDQGCVKWVADGKLQMVCGSWLLTEQ